jgi:RNA polymerase sigma-70 factor (ECF subfamily)
MTDTDEFSKLLVAEIPRLRGFARSLAKAHDRADDLVQEALYKAWAHRSSFRPGTNITAWLFIILRNTYYSQARVQNRIVEDPDGIYSQQLVTHAEQQIQAEFEEFKRVFARLRPEHREALYLIGACGMSYSEAAEVCNCPVGTVKSRVNRGRQVLAHLMGGASLELGPEPQAMAAVHGVGGSPDARATLSASG